MATRITVAPELWASCTFPGGLIEHWMCRDGCFVEAGEPVAAIRIEDCLHELTAPADGRLSIGLKESSIVQPGTEIGNIVPDTDVF